MGGGKLKFLESYNISDVEGGLVNSADQFAENTDSLIRLVEPEITSTIDITPENPNF
jgi:MinD-like ATPase involved in chromosome partitioning or flagellar assembly